MVSPRRLAKVLDEPLASSSSVAGCEGSLARRALEAIRAGVEDRTWQAFWRVAVDGLSPAEAAQALGISVGAVYKAKYRVTRLVRQQLGDLIE